MLVVSTFSPDVVLLALFWRVRLVFSPNVHHGHDGGTGGVGRRERLGPLEIRSSFSAKTTVQKCTQLTGLNLTRVTEPSGRHD